MTPSSLTLLLSDPERLIPEGETWPELPNLQRLLSKAERHPAGSDYFSVLGALFGLEGTAQTLPLAPLRALGDGVEVEEGWWLCADPVHLTADRDQLYLSAHHALAIRPEEAERLVAALNRLYADEGWCFIAPVPDRWYLKLPDALALTTTPTSLAMGCPVGRVLPGGEDAMSWQRVMTEIQMLFHGESVNLQREADGGLAINSLWFWGGGALPTSGGAVCWQRVVADEPLLRGLAALQGIATQGHSDDPGDVLAPGGGTLWQPNLNDFESLEALLAALTVMLRAGELAQLELLLPGYGRWHVERKTLRRWWRRNRPLAALLGSPSA